MPKRASWFVIFLLLSSSNAWAKPQHRQTLKKHYGSFLAETLNRCETCHLSKEQAPDAEAFDLAPPHNSFGIRLKQLGTERRQANQDADLVTRLGLIAAEDADGDGVSNEVEILTGHAPGRADDKPSEAELSSVEMRREGFRREASTRWDPLRPVVRPEVPVVTASGDAVQTPIDAFIAIERQARSLTAQPPAARHVLLRRLYLDLIGLVPTPAELNAFLADDSPNAYEKVVDRLLDDPRYGERWGRHWMDIWRYSDWAGWTGGNQIRDSQPHIWRWRDWIIESLNADKGYDQMIVEMLAGDEIAPTDPSVLRATGYLVRNYKMLSREVWMQDTVNHTTKAFLGMTLECARCHDHMYDPISQKEYYQVRALFEPHNVRIDRVPGEADTKKNGLVRVYDADPAAQTFLFVRGDDRTPDKDNPLPPGVPAALGGGKLEIQSVPLPLTAYSPEKVDYVVRETLAASEDAIAQAKSAAEKDPSELAAMTVTWSEAKHAALEAALRVEQLEDAGAREKEPESWRQAAIAASAAQKWASLAESRRNLILAERAVAQAATVAETATKKAEENPEEKKLQDAVQKAAKDLEAARTKLAEAATALAKAKQDALLPPTEQYTPRNIKVYPTASTGRRLAFARWLAHPSNPLTARVAVNHIWTRHFGQPIVPTVFDFGQGGRPPSHPQLLDWLAAELMEPSVPHASAPTSKPWSMKHIHRLIVLSQTYRMAATPDEANLAIDPDNVYFWRANSKRMEAELVRDNVLSVSGELDPTMGGAEIDHALGLKSRRRSLYFRHAAEKQMEFLKLFDGAAVSECYERRASVVPQQALALANSELSLVQSRRLARTLFERIGSDPAQFVTAAFEHVLSRRPTAAEQAECLTFLDQQPKLLAQKEAQLTGATDDMNDASKPASAATMRARENLVHALMNHSDFVTIR